MKLFTLKHVPTGKLLLDQTFANKPEAKAARDALNQDTKDKPYVVAPGPQHRHFSR